MAGARLAMLFGKALGPGAAYHCLPFFSLCMRMSWWTESELWCMHGGLSGRATMRL